MLAFQPPQLSRTPSSIQLSIATQTPPVIQPSCEITRTRSANPRLTRNRKTSANSSASSAPSIGCRSLTLTRKRVGSSRSAKTGRRTPSHTLPQNGEEAERLLSSLLSMWVTKSFLTPPPLSHLCKLKIGIRTFIPNLGFGV